jgi:hypothetical protein
MFDTRAVKRRLACAAAAVLLGCSAPLLAAGPPSGPDAESLATLRKATDYMAGLQRFSVQGHSTLEVVLTSGQKLQYDHDVAMVVERPNRLRGMRKGEVTDQIFYYDGATLTLHSPGDHVYATVPAPATLDGMLDFSRDELDIVSPATDLVYSDSFKRLTEDMTEGFVVGKKAFFGGQSCTHLAFRKPGVDIQIWIANGDRPLVYKYVLTTTDLPSSPQFIMTLSDWNTRPEITASTFKFAPPADAKRIEFAPATLMPASAR